MKYRLLNRIFFIFSALLFVGFSSLSMAQNVGDVIQNYGFEEGADAQGVPTGCVLGENDYNGNGQFLLDATIFHSGAASGLLQGIDDNDLSMDPFLPLFNVKEGYTYTYSVWLKTEVTDGAFAIQATNQDWSWMTYDEHPAVTADWTEFTGEFTPEADGQAAIVIGFYGKGKIWIDDCMVVLTEKIINVGEELFSIGFEAGDDESGLPIGTNPLIDWEGNGSIGEISNVAHTGNFSATIYNPTPGTPANASLDVPVGGHEKNAEYHLTIWIKTTGVTEGDAQVITEWDNARLINSITGDTEWTQYQLDYVAPSSGELLIRLHAQGMTGQAYYDDMVIIKTKDGFILPTDQVANPGFEIPNDDGDAPAYWFAEAWGSGSTDIGFPGNANARYIWDNAVFHSGQYSAKIQVTQADVEGGNMDAGWRTSNLEFISGGVYQLSYWVKTANFPTDYNTSRTRMRISIGYNNLDLTLIRANTDWVQVTDTLIFPTDQDDNAWRNDMRFRLSSSVTYADTMAEAWIDDVVFTLIGTQANQLDSIAVYHAGENSVQISWEPHPDVTSPVYHILMQPINENGVFENNLLSNPGFEEPNNDGSAPKDWTFYPDGWGAAPIGEFPADQTFDGNFSVYFGELDPGDPTGVFGRWMQTFNNSAMNYEQAYMYGAMVKYSNVVAIQDSIVDENHPDGYYWSCGVNIWYDRYGFQFQNESLISLGWSTPVGNSDGWVQIGLPLIYDQASGRHNFGIGLGQYWEGLAKGDLYIDNAFVVPFDEVATTTGTSITIDNVPAGVKYFAVYVEDASGEYIVSPAKIGLVKTLSGVEDNGTMPLKFELKQNYPNPFNPVTKIQYTIPETGDVKLTVYNILGQQIAVLVDIKNQISGTYTVDFNASNLASGVYFYRIDTPNNIKTKKMILLK